jgi:hypothetical protein
MPTRAPSKSPAKASKPRPKATSTTDPAKTPATKASAAKAASKATTKAPAAGTKAASRPRAPKTKSGPGAARPSKAGARAATLRPVFVPRAVANLDDDDVLMAHGGGGAGYGRCGGRLLSSRLEQQLCNRLGIAGVVHSHSPRHYEVRYSEGLVAAYAPMIVLRGRGREGKSVVIEGVDEAKAPILRKIVAFRGQYGQEFYVIMVADDEVLDTVPLASFDESCSSTNVNTLIARLAE